MPNVVQGFAPPAYWQAFEDLTVSVARLTFDDPAPQKVGRPGQSQHGLDVIVELPDGRRFGIQCKRREDRDVNNDPLPGGPITLDAVEAALEEVKAYKSGLDRFILATSAKTDSGLQAQVAKLSDGRRRAGKFPVQVWSWADYEAALNRDAALQNEYYAMVAQGRTALERDRHLLELFAEAFSRPAFHDPLSCEHRDDFRQAISNTQKALATGELQDRHGHRLRRADGGWRTLSDDDHRKGLAGVADALQQFRVTLIEAERSGYVGQQGDWFMIYDTEVQADLERRREAVVVALDKVLRAAGLHPLRDRR
ncbi:hypothetical protein EJ082_15120 [Brevundimonas diminuta]|uniref:Restriction endonuclease type IV Mrr domain-containing protein n=1 Tax=Brevundimonas diminuta TaxID=293 RepID=A0A410P073_BREDI|nr:hypothetical protein [Brevundimonas diminuta]MBD3574297.1 hypothetical protein [Brevundimonas diminuta]QAT15546.1 hypothetical protein EQG53_15015 [Brevundimonas diminuta]QQB90237.1 hypothetical protein I6H83_07435 [Brevundimonas diminuta]GEC02242.1 hypothetical protein BDI01nite_33060 [Brevundimonas diminuta]